MQRPVMCRIERLNVLSVYVLKLIKKMPTLLKMPGLNVTPDYIDAFFRANNSFLYQLVFDPIHRKLVPLNPYPDDVDADDLHYAGPYPFCSI